MKRAETAALWDTKTQIKAIRCSTLKKKKTRWLRPDKYNENHSKAFPPIPKAVVKRFSKIAAWSTVSKAALKSKRTSSDTLRVHIQ